LVRRRRRIGGISERQLIVVALFSSAGFK